MLVEWVPRKINAFADEIFKWLIPYYYSNSRPYFIMFDCKWGPHNCDLSWLVRTIICSKFNFVHRCRGTSGINGFGFDRRLDIFWIRVPFRLIGKIWSKFREQGAKATSIFPPWTSSTWWHLIAPDAMHFSIFLIDWILLPRNNPFLFVSGQTPGGRVISPPDWQIMALRVDFSATQSDYMLSKRNRCIREGCHACASNTLSGISMPSTNCWLGR